MNRRNIPEKIGNFIFHTLAEWLLYLVAFLLIVDKVMTSTLNKSILTYDNNDLKVTLGLALVVLFIISFKKQINKISKKIDSMSNKYLGVLEVLNSHEIVDFAEMLQNSNEIRLLTLSGTKVASLGDATIKDLLADSKRKSKIKILLANPFSQAIIDRYKNDEPSTFEAGTDGIKRRLLWLYNITKKIPKSKLEVRIYNNYPVISILQADNDIYSTSYGYKLRGGDCPKIHSHINGEYGKFLLKHFEKVYNDSILLEDWIKKYKNKLDWK